jgi:hypothetical protein
MGIALSRLVNGPSRGTGCTAADIARAKGWHGEDKKESIDKDDKINEGKVL